MARYLNSAYEPLRNVILHARIGYMMQNHSAQWIPLLGSWYSLCLPPTVHYIILAGRNVVSDFFDTVAWILDRVLDSNALR